MFSSDFFSLFLFRFFFSFLNALNLEGATNASWLMRQTHTNDVKRSRWACFSRFHWIPNRRFHIAFQHIRSDLSINLWAHLLGLPTRHQVFLRRNTCIGYSAANRFFAESINGDVNLCRWNFMISGKLCVRSIEDYHSNSFWSVKARVATSFILPQLKLTFTCVSTCKITPI